MDAWAFSPNTAFDRGKIKGKLLGQQIAAKEWKHVHLIGHSAGSAVIQAAVDEVTSEAPSTEIHTTFLDPFLRFNFEGRGWFGSGADWSENYFADDLETSAVTGGRLPNAHNIEVTWLDNAHITGSSLLSVAGISAAERPLSRGMAPSGTPQRLAGLSRRRWQDLSASTQRLGNLGASAFRLVLAAGRTAPPLAPSANARQPAMSSAGHGQFIPSH